MSPYKERTNNNKITREFSVNVDSDDLVWHRDKRDRNVRVVEGVGWQLQFDDEMPIELVEGEVYFIPKNHYHRIIKGFNSLSVEIAEE